MVATVPPKTVSRMISPNLQAQQDGLAFTFLASDISVDVDAKGRGHRAQAMNSVADCPATHLPS